MRTLGLLLAACCLATASPGLADLAACDRLTAHPLDPDRAAEGVHAGELDGAAALAACSTAAEAEPANARLRYQLGRAQERLGEFAAARRSYETAADGHPFALAALAGLHEDGLGGGRDAARALALYEQALEAGVVAAAVPLGWLLGNGPEVRDQAKARRLYQSLADLGAPEGENGLGLVHEYGWGVPVDLARAAAHYRKAADQGLDIAQTNLALAYFEGRGVEQDRVEAARLFRHAADQGFARAQLWLGYLHADGFGVPQDSGEARAWMEEAAAQSHVEAYLALGDLHSSGRLLPQDLAQAETWYRKAMASGEKEEGANALAWMNAVTGRNLDEARRLAEEVVASDPERANWQDTLGLVYLRLGEADKAVAALEQATRLVPEFAASFDRLGDAYAAAGRNEEAQAAWQRALELAEAEAGAPPALSLEPFDPAATARKLGEG